MFNNKNNFLEILCATIYDQADIYICLVSSFLSAIAYLYASALGLEYQLLIVTVVLFFSTLSFFLILFDDDSNTSVGQLQLGVGVNSGVGAFFH